MNDTPELTRLVLAWGPGLLFMLGAGWVAYKLGDKVITAQIQSRQHQFEAIREMLGHFADRFVAAQDAQAAAINRLAGAVETGLNEQRDMAVALRALALKIDEMKNWVERGNGK